MAIYMSGDMIGVNDASGRTSYDPGQQIPKFCWTMVHNSGILSSDYSVDVNTGEWYGAMISITHNDDNVMYDNDLWFGSGDYYAATVVQLGRVGDVDRISDPTVATSNGVRTITFAATGLTAGSTLRCYLMRFK